MYKAYGLDRVGHQFQLCIYMYLYLTLSEAFVSVQYIEGFFSIGLNGCMLMFEI